MTPIEEIQRAAKKALTPKRYEHTIGVVEAAKEIASRYDVDITKAETAGWLHDIAREWPAERLLQAAENIEIPAGFAAIPELLHGPIAAHIGRVTFGIEDDDILNAVSYHTTGRVGMSKLEKVIFLADAIERGRQYPGVMKIRELAKENLNLAVKASLDSTITYLLQAEQPIFPLTVMARNAFLEETIQQSVKDNGGKAE